MNSALDIFLTIKPLLLEIRLFEILLGIFSYVIYIDLCITIWSLDIEALRPVMTPTFENIWVNLTKVQ